MSHLATHASSQACPEALTRKGWRTRAPLLFAAVVLSSACLFSAYAYLGGMTHGPPIRSDGYGYYAYLPSIFVDGNLAMKTPKEFRWTVVGNRPLPYEWDGISVYGPSGKFLDKYTLGTALLQSPFFLAAMAFAKVTGFPPDGYSLPFQIASQLSGMLYLSAGAFLLFSYLLRHFSLQSSAMVVISIIFATNILHYGTYQATFSHAYSFFLFSLLLLFVDVYRGCNAGGILTLIYSAGLGFVVGLITLTRVPNFIAVLIPASMVLESFTKHRDSRRSLLELLCGISAFVVTFAPQAAYWYAVTGHVLVNSYLGESFHWLHPHILLLLFGIRGGVFFWAPIILLAVAGLPLLIRRDLWLGAAISLVLSLEIYICASWWIWWFGTIFGSRPFADVLPLVAPPLACVFSWIDLRLSRIIPIAIASVVIPLNLVLMLSHWKYYLPWSDATFTNLEELPTIWEARSLLPALQRVFLPLYLPGTPFLVDGPPPMSMIVEGWQETPAPAIWSVGSEASLSIRPKLPALGDLCLNVAFAGRGALLTLRHPTQRAIIRVDGVTVGSMRLALNGNNSRRVVDIPRRMLRDGRRLRIALELPDAVAPESLGINHDPRLLALYVSRISVDTCEP